MTEPPARPGTRRRRPSRRDRPPARATRCQPECRHGLWHAARLATVPEAPFKRGLESHSKSRVSGRGRGLGLARPRPDRARASCCGWQPEPETMRPQCHGEPGPGLGGCHGGASGSQAFTMSRPSTVNGSSSEYRHDPGTRTRKLRLVTRARARPGTPAGHQCPSPRLKRS
jgi:hypothetical protein